MTRKVWFVAAGVAIFGIVIALYLLSKVPFCTSKREGEFLVNAESGEWFYCERLPNGGHEWRRISKQAPR